MGKVKYRKRSQSIPGSTNKRNSSSVTEEMLKVSCSKPKIEVKTFRHSQRRLAITPNDLNAEERFLLACKNVMQNSSFGKDKDLLSVTIISKRAKKRILAKKKLAGAFGNMDSLIDALPTLEKDSKNSSRTVEEKPRLSRSFKMRDLGMANDIQFYHCAVRDPSFLADPFSAAAANIRQRLLNEQKESS